MPNCRSEIAEIADMLQIHQRYIKTTRLTRVGRSRMSAFAPEALTDALAEQSVSQTRACAAALGDGSGITSGLADWRKRSPIAAILPTHSGAACIHFRSRRFLANAILSTDDVGTGDVAKR